MLYYILAHFHFYVLYIIFIEQHILQDFLAHFLFAIFSFYSEFNLYYIQFWYIFIYFLFNL